MSIRFFALCLLLLVAAGGCSTLRTAQTYAEEAVSFINPDPEIDYQDLPKDGPEEVLAYLFAPVDERIQLLAEGMITVDSKPGREWFESFGLRYPWLTGVAVLDTDGKVDVAMPEQGLRKLPAQELLALRENWVRGGLAVTVRKDELGPEVYFVQPITEEGVFSGLVVSHFDPRSLRRYCPDPDRLLMWTPDVDLWPIDGAKEREAIHSMDWDDVLTDKVHGHVGERPHKYVWVARRLGNTHILYAASAN